MTLRQRLTATRTLVLAGIVLGFTSYGLYKLGGPPELYPFFHWRLYSAPTGADTFTTYRFYKQDAAGEEWQRLPIRPTQAYTRKEYAWQFGNLVSEALSDSLGRTDAAERLAVFAREVVPDTLASSTAELRVVAETYYPQKILQGDSRYDTTTVLHVTQ